jgi:uncharacterized protein
MFYIDTSVAVALLAQEPQTEAASTILTRLMQQGLRGVCSDWTSAEYRCAVAAKHCAGHIKASDLMQVANALDILRVAKFSAAPTLSTDVVRAGALALQVAKHPLRAGDALHLAIAARLGVTHFVTFDLAQATAARTVLVGVTIVVL